MPLNKNEPVLIVPYDPAWPREFARLSRVLADALRELIITIEHVGSTAVPGLPAKPILDLDLVIAGNDRLQPVTRRLEQLGYRPEGDQGIPGRWAMGRMSRTTPWTPERREWVDHHLYICCRDNMELKRHIYLREVLRHDSELAGEYGSFKKELAAKLGQDRLGYTEAKSEFLQKILQTAHPYYDLNSIPGRSPGGKKCQF